MAKLQVPRAVLSVIVLIAGLSPSAHAAEKGKFVPWAYTCHFGKYGRMVIDGTHKGAVYLKVGGKTYLTNGFGGAYGFEVDGGPSVLRGFTDSGREFFIYNDVRDDHCIESTSVPK